MTKHLTGTRKDWLSARLKLLKAEKELTRHSDELARLRQALPWVPVEKTYLFDTEDGSASLAELFRGRSQLLVYHFMYGPDYTAGCPNCSAIADGFNGFVTHLANHDVMLWAISRASIDKLKSYKQRMGWHFPWASTHGAAFNHDFHVGFTEEQLRSGMAEYNYGTMKWPPLPIGKEGPLAEFAGESGTNWATYTQEAPGMSAFAMEDGVIYHTYSSYARGLDSLWGLYQWLDRAPRGRNESGMWIHRHDEYEVR